MIAEVVAGTRCLRAIPGIETVLLPACGGSRLISEAGDLFVDGIDPGFVDYDANRHAPDTPEALVEILEMAEDADFVKMFGCLTSVHDLDVLCLTQSQIIQFCVSHRDKMSTRGLNFFLLKSGQELFVVGIAVSKANGFYFRASAEIYYFWSGEVLSAKIPRRIIVPRIA